MTASKSTWEQYRMPALLDVADFLWVNPPFANMTGHVWPAAANSTGIPGLRGGWQADVTQAIADSSELFRAGAFVGVFLGDEPCSSGVSAEALALAAAFVKALIAPLGGWTYVNECDHTFWTIGNTTYPGQMTGLVPAGIDVISIDRYMPANGTGQLTLPSVGCNYDGYYGPAQEAACNRAFYERHNHLSETAARPARGGRAGPVREWQQRSQCDGGRGSAHCEARRVLGVDAGREAARRDDPVALDRPAGWQVCEDPELREHLGPRRGVLSAVGRPIETNR